MTFWKTFWASFLASIISGILVMLLFFLILSMMIAGFGSMFESKKLTVNDNTVLHMELDGEIGDFTYAEIAGFQFEKQFGLIEILEGIKLAKYDPKIKGIFLNCDNVSAGMATIKEIRDALADFQASGKFLVSYHENYDKKAYYLASVAKEVYVFPSGMFEFLGLGNEMMFFKGALEKLEVEMQIIRGSNNKFKSAVEPWLYDKMSDESRAQAQKYMDALWLEMTTAIASSRNMKVQFLDKIADSAFIRKAGDAVKYKMADGIKYYDEVLDILTKKAGTPAGKKLELLSFQKYALKMVKEEQTLDKKLDKNIAVIVAEGEIVDGAGEANQIGGTSLSEQIREARMDEKIKAVVLRINSPGGSAMASDIIWREVTLTKAVKPVVVSMGDVAASGGYYIACGADKIYAQPNTITGSIGVFGIVPYTGDMFKNKLGITFDGVQTNEHATVPSMNKRLTEFELKLIQQGVDDIYEDFISKVGAGRGMKKADVDSIGQGRVWAGTDAKRIGLVDEFGGLQEAVNDAAKRAGIEQKDIVIKYYLSAEVNEFFEILENFENPEEEPTEKTKLQMQLMEIYSYLSTIGQTTQYQARLPYLFWIN
jgi:protease-4